MGVVIPNTFSPGEQILSAQVNQNFATLAAAVNALSSPVALVNEWPDPQFCIQDSSMLTTGINDTLTGTFAPNSSITGYSTGSRTVVVNATSTVALLVGSRIQFTGGGLDPALQAGGGAQLCLEVTNIVANTSFTVIPEYGAGTNGGVPTSSVPCTATIVMHGDFSGSANGNVTANVQRYANGITSPAFWISDRPAHTSLLKGCRRVLIVQKVTNSPELIYWNCPPSRLASMSNTNRATGFAVYVASGAGANAQCYFNDGTFVTSGAIASQAQRTWISGQHTVANNPSMLQCGIQLQGPIGSVFVIGEFTHCASPALLLDGSFSTPRGQMIRFLASVSPWNGAAFTTPATGFTQSTGVAVNLIQASGGIINEGVSILHGLFEGVSGGVGNLLGFANDFSAPSLYNPILRTPTASQQGFTSGNWNLDENANMVVYGTTSVAWSALDFDFHAATLLLGP